MTVLYLYLVVWGVTHWGFSVWASNCTYCVDLCHFSRFLAHLSPPANHSLILMCILVTQYCWQMNTDNYIDAPKAFPLYVSFRSTQAKACWGLSHGLWQNVFQHNESDCMEVTHVSTGWSRGLHITQACHCWPGCLARELWRERLDGGLGNNDWRHGRKCDWAWCEPTWIVQCRWSVRQTPWRSLSTQRSPLAVVSLLRSPQVQGKAYSCNI